MKDLFSILLFLISYHVVAQDSTEVNVKSPKIINKLSINNSLKVNDVELKFIKVISDSRCPKNVQCVWAGEVEVLVVIFKNGKEIEQKRLKVGPKTSNPGKANLYASEKMQINALSVSPYPINGKKIKDEEYSLLLNIRE